MLLQNNNNYNNYMSSKSFVIKENVYVVLLEYFDGKIEGLTKEKVKEYAEYLMRVLTLRNQSFGMSEADAQSMALDMLLEDAPELIKLSQG